MAHHPGAGWKFGDRRPAPPFLLRESSQLDISINPVKITIDLLERMFYYLFCKRMQRGAIMTTLEKLKQLSTENKEIVKRQIEILKESQSKHQSPSDSQE